MFLVSSHPHVIHYTLDVLIYAILWSIRCRSGVAFFVLTFMYILQLSKNIILNLFLSQLLKKTDNEVFKSG